MTEYTSSRAYHDFRTSQERTSYWVNSHGPSRDSGFYSPSVPPSMLNGLVSSSPPSDAGSSHSTPPNMVLRYNDGRPDLPIPNPYGRQISSGSNDSPHSRPARPDDDFSAPEEIRILPSSGAAPTSVPSRPGHSRSKSLPRNQERDREFIPDPDHPFIPSHQSHAYYPSQVPHASHRVPANSNFPQPQHHSSSRHHSHHKHSSSYATNGHPSSHRHHYPQQPLYHHPHHIGPNGVMYSHSAPIPGQYPPVYPVAYPHSSSGHDGMGSGRGRSFDHSRSRGHSSRTTAMDSSASLGTHVTGSTYYMNPATGQKVHVIAPSPEHSVITATSTTKSVTSPHGQEKRTFFHRLFSFGKHSSASSTTSGGRKLHRSYSLSASARPSVGKGH